MQLYYTYITLSLCLGIISKLDMISSTWENVHSLYVNTTPLYVKNLSILRFWYPHKVLELIPHSFRGTTIGNPFWKNV